LSYSGEDESQLDILVSNAQREDLSLGEKIRAARRAEAAIENLRAAGRTHGLTRDLVGNVLNVSGRTAGVYLKLVHNLCDEGLSALDGGNITLQDAEAISDLAPAEQVKAIGAVGRGSEKMEKRGRPPKAAGELEAKRILKKLESAKTTVAKVVEMLGEDAAKFDEAGIEGRVKDVLGEIVTLIEEEKGKQ
jgi:hypothetical protein